MDERYAKAIIIRQHLNSEQRRYIVNDTLINSFSILYEKASMDKRLYYYATDKFGSVSDCWILYAVMLLGVCDISAISHCLQAFSNNSTDLALPDYNNLDALKVRIKKLHSIGFLVKTSFCVNEQQGNKYCSLYSCAADAIDFIAQRLDKPYKSIAWIQAKRPQEAVSWGAATLVGSTLALYPSFKKFGLGRLYFQKKTTYYPVELKYKIGETEYDVAVIDSFLSFDKRVMTNDDFKDFIIQKLNTIMQYIEYRSNVCNARVVCVIENNENLVLLAKWIKKVERLRDILPFIYFIGEGAVKDFNGDAAYCMLKMECSEKYEAGFTFYQAYPDFLG